MTGHDRNADTPPDRSTVRQLSEIFLRYIRVWLSLLWQAITSLPTTRSSDDAASGRQSPTTSDNDHLRDGARRSQRASDTQLIPDGGAQETDPHPPSDEWVRSYQADGIMFAYSDGDEHVVVSEGKQPEDQWEQRVPAERTAVLPDEHLWTYPENWTRVFILNPTRQKKDIFYYIPETDVYVKIHVPEPHQVPLANSWCTIHAVGSLTFEFDSSCKCNSFDWDRLEDHIESIDPETDDIDPAVVAAFEDLVQQSNAFERYYADIIESAAEDDLRKDEQDRTIEDVEYFGSTVPVTQKGEPYEWYVSQFLDLDSDTSERLEEAFPSGVIPRYPRVRVDVDDTGRPDGYKLHALIEMGCEPQAALDYMMVESYGQTQSRWAAIRDTDEETIAENITSVEQTIQR